MSNKSSIVRIDPNGDVTYVGDTSSGIGDIIWIYVGTNGVDGVDDLLAANPHPYATGDSPGPPPFDNGTNSGGNLPPMAFALLGDDLLLLNGAWTGVTAGDSIFTLPSGFRPFFQQILPAPWIDQSAEETVTINPDGTVIDSGPIS